MEDLWTFFPGLRAPSGATGITFAKVRITTREDPFDITADRNSELNAYKYNEHEGLYLAQLQEAEEVKEIGFLLYTGGFTDVNGTVEVINRSLRRIHSEIRVGRKIKIIIQVSEATKEKDKNGKRHWTVQPWRAVKLEVERSQAYAAVAAVTTLFNTVSERPGEIKFRFLPDKKYEQMSRKKTAFQEDLLAKHQAILSVIEYSDSDGVMHLDKKVKGKDRHSITLRKLILRKTNPEGKSIFHSVDRAQGTDDQIVAHSFPEYLADAKHFMSLLPAVARHKVGDKAEKWFSPEVWLASLSIVYDPETNDYTSPDVHCLGAIADESFPASIVITNIPDMMPVNHWPAALDNCSLVNPNSTIGTANRSMDSAYMAAPRPTTDNSAETNSQQGQQDQATTNPSSILRTGTATRYNQPQSKEEQLLAQVQAL